MSISDYVLDSMPDDLRRVVDGEIGYRELADRQRAVLLKNTQAILAENDLDRAQIHRLDLLMILGCYLPTGAERQTAPELLWRLIEAHRERFPELDSFMSYALLIDVNTAEFLRTGRMRTYSTGVYARYEQDFYLRHHNAERYALRAAREIADLLDGAATVGAGEAFSAASADLGGFLAEMNWYTAIPREAFHYFRPFINSYADGTPNASGAYMASVQLLEMAVTSPSGQLRAYVESSIPYFPKWSRGVLREWLEASRSGRNVEAFLTSGRMRLDTEEREDLLSVVDKLLAFRMTHLGVARKMLPEAFADGEILTRKMIAGLDREEPIRESEHGGTGGIDARAVLVNGALRLMKLRERISSNV